MTRALRLGSRISMRLKEDLLRSNATFLGRDTCSDYILPGGVAADLPGDAHELLIALYAELEQAAGGTSLHL